MVIRTENIVITVVSEFEMSILANVSTWNNDVEYIYTTETITDASTVTLDTTETTLCILLYFILTQCLQFSLFSEIV
jgi:hypothetical protein